MSGPHASLTLMWHSSLICLGRALRWSCVLGSRSKTWGYYLVEASRTWEGNIAKQAGLVLLSPGLGWEAGWAAPGGKSSFAWDYWGGRWASGQNPKDRQSPCFLPLSPYTWKLLQIFTFPAVVLDDPQRWSCVILLASRVPRHLEVFAVRTYGN